MSGKAPEWETQKQSRLKRNTHSECTPDKGLFFDRDKKHCCRMCPAGERLVAPCTSPGGNATCSACEKGAYLLGPHSTKDCKRCWECGSEEIEVKSCTASSDTQCRCRDGSFKVPIVNICQPCKQCINRETVRNCSETEDSECGKCWPGFFYEQEECRPCTDLPTGTNSEQNICSLEKTELPVIFITTGVFIALLIVIGGFLIYCYRRKKKRGFPQTVQDKEKSTDDIEHWQNAKSPPKVIVSLPQSQFLVSSPDMIIDIKVKNKGVISPQTPLLPNNTEATHYSVLQQGKTLYNIINAVPARRWKEFMRTLELNDGEIERVEVEFSYFREQQYEMLKSWTQQKDTTMESIYSALKRMDLSGCAEELQRTFETCP